MEVELVPAPDDGPDVRVFEADRRCRIGDCDADARLRLDAVARYLQDVAYDDYADAGFADEPDATWVARRVTVDVHRAPRFEEVVRLRTWASALASRWAERRIQVLGEHGGRLEAAVLWVFVRASTGSPAPLPEDFLGVYAGAAAGRIVRARFRHDAAVPDGVAGFEWPLRSTDLDVLRHVNNAAYWPALEELLSTVAPGGGVGALGPLRAEVEHRRPIESGTALRLLHRGDPAAGLDAWLVDAVGDVAATFRVGPVPAQAGP